jgi:hypothetical protein
VSGLSARLYKFGGTSAIAAAAMTLVASVGVSSAAVSPPRAPHRWDRGWHRLGIRRPYRARAAIVGGSQISIEQAPWQAAVLVRIPVEHGALFELCGGSIIDETRVLTAAHCVFNPTNGEHTPPEDFVVVVGASDLATEEAGAEGVEVASVRVHPYFDYAAGPGASDDVAVLKLSKSLHFTSRVRSIGLSAPGANPSEGTQVNLTGFGLQDPETEEPNGLLYSLGMTLGFSRRCGGEADAVFLCASTPLGSACSGDSGGGLTDPGSTPGLLGVASTVEGHSGEFCGDGAIAGLTNLAAPEIQDFIAGSEDPPRAPRGEGVAVRGVLTVGHSLTCEPGSWSGEPTFTYEFIDSAEGQILQSGPSATYQLSAADVGRTILCLVQAGNAGGTGAARTTALASIKAAAGGEQPPEHKEGLVPQPQPGQPSRGAGAGQVPQPVVGGPQPPVSPAPETPATATAEGIALVGTSLAVRRGDETLVKLDCTVSGGCSGRLTLAAKDTSKIRGRRTLRMRTIGTARFSIADGEAVVVKLTLDATGRALLNAAHGGLYARLTILEPEATRPQSESVRLVAQPKNGAAKGRR